MTDATTMHPLDADAVLWRDGIDGRAGSDLLVVMHGIGSHEGDLFALAPFLPEHLTIAALRAPLRYGPGHAWYAAGSQMSTDATLIDASARGVLAWLDGLEDEFRSVSLLGFSQGGAMTLQLLRLAPERFAAVVQLSGFVFRGASEGDAALAAAEPRVPAFQAWGTQDDIIARDATSRTVAWMREHTDVEAHEYAMSHSIVQEELRDVAAFLERVLPASGR
ncbi:dienelactone hydrolase family protein [Agrococcus versicolor]|uniref:Dienelactone hydrolase family protein n=1 Tax=Agrococcus versicolor TaxID=501482 RepID=A0ABP5MQ00_9MICO